MMKEDLKPTVEILNIFKQVRLIIYMEMNDLFNNFAFNIYEYIDKNYEISVDDYINYILSEHITIKRNNKLLQFEFAEIQTPSKTIYMIYTYIENRDPELSVFARTFFHLDYLDMTNREDIKKLFPKDYEINKGESVDKNKIYEYVKEYLSAVKVMLAEPDFQKLLYDPDFWVYTNPYK